MKPLLLYLIICYFNLNNLSILVIIQLIVMASRDNSGNIFVYISEVNLKEKKEFLYK